MIKNVLHLRKQWYIAEERWKIMSLDIDKKIVEVSDIFGLS